MSWIKDRSEISGREEGNINAIRIYTYIYFTLNFKLGSSHFINEVVQFRK